MAEHIHRITIGNDGGYLSSGTGEGHVRFEHAGYCCAGCEEGHNGTTISAQPVEMTVAYRDDLPPGAAAIEVRWNMGTRPQRLLLDFDAAEELISALTFAQFGIGAADD